MILTKNGIQPYRFEPRVETVSSVDEARSARSSSGEDDDGYRGGRAKPTVAKFGLVGNEAMFVSGRHKIFR